MTRIRPRAFLPNELRWKLRANILGALGETVAQGYERYAQSYTPAPGTYLGDEWNEPEVIGMDVARDEIVPTLDRIVFQPFLGKCDVILEIGAGAGRFTGILFPKCRKVIASDTSRSMLSLLAKRFPNHPQLEILLLDGQGLAPLQDRSIDAAFSYDVFNHLEHWDIFNYLVELKRVLKPGGRAVIHHANTFSELGWKRFVDDMPQQLNLSKSWGTLSLMTPDLFRELAERAGLHCSGCVTDLVRRDGISLLQSLAA
jgi:SAM-dependent methyltransferase